MNESGLDDARSTDPVERLLEDSWQARSRLASRRELLVEALTAAAFLGCAIPLALSAFASHRVDLLLAAVLVGLYALVSQVIQFPIGAGYVVPSYLVLVPMLVLLPPGVVPVLVAGSLLLGTLGQIARTRERPERMLSSIADAWHALGPALVLLLAADVPGERLPLVYIAAFVAGCMLDLLFATARETAILGVRPRVQLQVIAVVWLIDACLAPLGLLIAIAVRHNPAAILLTLPLNVVLLLLSRDRNTRIAQAQRRLDLVGRERTRLQTAVQRLGEAFAAKLDLEALTDIVLRGSIEAVDADAGRLALSGPLEPRTIEIATTGRIVPALKAASEQARTHAAPCQLERDGVWALALPFGFESDAGHARGALAVAREDRAFRDDERTVVNGLVERARTAAADIVAHQLLREQALTDSLTKLGNRRKLAAEINEHLAAASAAKPLVLIIFDLDGFKSYNDTFGHVAGDAMLARLGEKLAAAVCEHGAAYRLGGDEFCVLFTAQPAELGTVLLAAAGALEERGENFAVGASSGAVLLPHEATDLDYAIQLADERMYERKKERHSPAADPTGEVLIRILHARQPSLQDHSSEVATLCLRVGRRLAMPAEELDVLVRAAELHDIGKVGIPDEILQKPGPLDAAEWEFMRQHTVLGERILNAAPALRPVATIVRATHERWDGRGYPDSRAGDEIPLAARVIAACDAYEAMTSERCYRGRRDHEGARGELRREAGHQFDPTVVEVLLDELDRHGASSKPRDHAREAPAPGANEVAAQLLEVLAHHAADASETRTPSASPA